MSDTSQNINYIRFPCIHQTVQSGHTPASYKNERIPSTARLFPSANQAYPIRGSHPHGTFLSQSGYGLRPTAKWPSEAYAQAYPKWGSHPHGTFLSQSGYGLPGRLRCNPYEAYAPTNPIMGPHPHGRKSTALKGGAFLRPRRDSNP